jgi:hypothetical protein
MTDNVKRGLAAIKAHQEEEKAKQAARERPKATWFKWPNDVTTVATVRFLQEMDESASGYREDRDLGVIAVEHQAPGPDGFKRRALCTAESEGDCYACERHALDYTEGWRQRKNFYINALVSFNGEAPEVMVISRNGNSAFVEQVVAEAIDENTITDKNFRITKVGTCTSTNWILKALPKDEPFDDSNVEVFNLNETALRDIEYAKQAEYYGAVYKGKDADETSESGSTSDSSADAEW